jgi:methylase of polypeptide subunit release factors
VLSGEFLSMIPRAGRVMDFGCGSGRNALYLAGRGHEVSIYDVSEEALAFSERAADSKGRAVQRCRREGRPRPAEPDEPAKEY